MTPEQACGLKARDDQDIPFPGLERKVVRTPQSSELGAGGASFAWDLRLQARNLGGAQLPPWIQGTGKGRFGLPARLAHELAVVVVKRPLRWDVLAVWKRSQGRPRSRAWCKTKGAAATPNRTEPNRTETNGIMDPTRSM
eukprot:7647622-Alexandrium_andersonii.AAC.1